MIVLDGQGLTLAQIEAVARERSPVRLHDDAKELVRRSRATLERLLEEGVPVYGVTTGFGRLADVTVARDDQRALQRNLVRSHAAGTGRPLSVGEVRAVLLLRANALARGHSGVRLVVVERLVEMLNRGVHPVVPEIGSVGASGDLAPLAHVALALMGEGRAAHGSSGETEAAEALAQAGIAPLDLAEKEGVALVNGTQATTALGALALRRFARALDAADVAGAASLEGLMGTPDAFRPEIHAVRPHPGQAASAARLWELLQDSEIRESHRHDDPRVQDAYSLRCMPQVHGAAREALEYASRIVATEANSTTDNPLVLPDAAVAPEPAAGPEPAAAPEPVPRADSAAPTSNARGAVLSGGNFHAQIVAQCLDLAAIAAADVASISERRTDRLLNPDLSGLPAFLTHRPGVCSGFMIAQITAADALSEMRVLATPASVDSVPTSASREDHVSMGMTAARKFRRSVELLETVLAVELLCAAQAVEFHRPLRAGRGVEEAVAVVRRRAPPLKEDRSLAAEIEAVAQMVRDGALAADHAQGDIP